MPKSTAIDISEIASSSVSPLGVHQERPHLAECVFQRKIDGRFLVDRRLGFGAELLQIVGVAEAVHQPFVLGLEQRVVETLERCSRQAGLLPAADMSMTFPAVELLLHTA
jgi:hypothetical protein